MQSVPLESGALATVPSIRQRLVERLASAKLSELYAAGWSDREICIYCGVEPGWAEGISTLAFEISQLGADLSSRCSTREMHLLLRTLDTLPVGLAFFDHQQALVSANRVLFRLLNDVPDAERLQQEIRHFVQSLATLVGMRRPAASEVHDLAARKVTTGRAPYQLRGSFIGFDLFGTGGTLLITVEQLTVPLPCDKEMREGLGLSPKECEIALLLAEGKSNAEIAKELFMSPHTARTHTRRILGKLGVHTRAEIRPKLQSL